MEAHPLKEVETRAAKIALRKDRIITVTFKRGVIVEKEDQYENAKIFCEWAGNVRHNFLFSPEPEVILTKEARETAAILENSTPILAIAIIAESLPVKLITNFYIKFHKPNYPLKSFMNKNEAIA